MTNLTTKIEGQLSIDDAAAEVLNAISSSRFLREVFRALPAELKANRDPDDLVGVLNSVHCQTARILRVRAAARRAAVLAAEVQTANP